MANIAHIQGRQIYDSRGNPTVEVDVFLDDDSMGRVAVPSGASTGSQEAYELRDNEKAFQGKGVQKAVRNVNTKIKDALVGTDAANQKKVDRVMIELDNTRSKKRIGANAILGVSLATAKAEAASQGKFFFEYVQGFSENDIPYSLPMPMCNLINGGKHAIGSTDIQEFMVVPVGARSMSEALQMVAEIFQILKDILKSKGYKTTVGDEGGFAPRVKKGNKEALELLSKAAERAGYDVGADVAFAIDVAANEMHSDGRYTLKSENKQFDAQGMIDYYTSLTKEFPLISIEDGLFEQDLRGWVNLTEALGESVQIVGDDFLVTNIDLLDKAIKLGAGNTILIKPNQIGTLSETIEAVELAQQSDWNTIVSHRSGETEDTTIAHLAVGLSSGQIKTGSMSRGERTAKYNELLRIEELFGEENVFATWKIDD